MIITFLSGTFTSTRTTSTTGNFGNCFCCHPCYCNSSYGSYCCRANCRKCIRHFTCVLGYLQCVGLQSNCACVFYHEFQFHVLHQHSLRLPLVPTMSMTEVLVYTEAFTLSILVFK